MIIDYLDYLGWLGVAGLGVGDDTRHEYNWDLFLNCSLSRSRQRVPRVSPPPAVRNEVEARQRVPRASPPPAVRNEVEARRRVPRTSPPPRRPPTPAHHRGQHPLPRCGDHGPGKGSCRLDYVSFAMGVDFVGVPRRVCIGEFGYMEDRTWDSCNCSMFTPEALLLHGHHLLPVSGGVADISVRESH